MKNIYIRLFKQQDKRPPGSGGSNTLIHKETIDHGFFPQPKRPPGEQLKFYYGTSSENLEYGYSGSITTKDEVRIKSFSKIMSIAGAEVGDIGIFSKRENELNAYDVRFIKASDESFDFYKRLLQNATYYFSSLLIDSEEVKPTNTAFLKLQKNWLIYGAPGTGKSSFLDKESIIFGPNKKRITFYPDYSYAKFLGSYKPVSFYKNSNLGYTYHNSRADAIPHPDIKNEPLIDYRFVPGPFMESLINAYKGANKGEQHLLIIEELNRANAPAVFGEVFQLLDRKLGKSEYRVTLSEEAMNHVKEELEEIDSDLLADLITNGLYIPSNLFIWSTMNSADQGVFPLDSAFKRRWAVQYLPLNEHENEVPDVSLSFSGESYKWNLLRRSINDYLTNHAGVAEDRLIAPFFLSYEQLTDLENLNETFKNKVLLYLKDDVLRHKKGFFNMDNQTISSIHEHFKKDINPVLNYDFFSILQQGVDGAAGIIKQSYDHYIAKLSSTNDMISND